MAMTITVSDENNLQKLKNLLGFKDESEAVEYAVEKVVKEFEQNSQMKNLSEEYFENLFSEEMIADGESIKAVLNEREESEF